MGGLTNSDARSCVLRKQKFRTSNGTIFGEWSHDDLRYAVFSYGHHFPMYVWDSETQQWYGNEDKYSVTTSKHQNQCRPSSNIVLVDTLMLKTIFRQGYRQTMADRVLGKSEPDWAALLHKKLEEYKKQAVKNEYKRFWEQVQAQLNGMWLDDKESSS